MGYAYSFECNNCKYHLFFALGVGFLYPKYYNEMIINMKDGKYGKQGKEFFQAFPNGAINVELVLAQCLDCGEYYNIPDLTLYVPNDENSPQKSEGNWSSAMRFEGVKYVSNSDLKEYYTEFEKYKHTCLKCGGNLKILNFESTNFISPKCGNVLKLTGGENWD